MKIIKTEDYIKKENPTPGKFYRSDVLTNEDQAKEIGGIFGFSLPAPRLLIITMRRGSRSLS